MPPGYEFVRVLGSGGCGWVALARQAGLERLVAVKTLFAGRYDDDERRRLEREGQALARLRDPHIVAVYALETVGDDVALVLEFVDGTDLRVALDERRLSGPQLLRALTDAAGALDHAAAAGVVHRDIKPGNVLLTRDGRAKLTDFGIARLAASAGAFRTAGSVVIGTPRYMPPEQITEPERESPAADAYSFACMVYEVLTGRPPFDAADMMQLFWAHTNAAPPSPRSLVPHLSLETEAVLLAGLAKDPRQRPTPGQLMAVLNRHPDEWVHLVAEASPPEAATAAPSVTPSLAAPPPRQVTTTGVAFAAGEVPWVEPALYRPPATPPARRRVPPLVVGALAGLLVVLVVALLL
ncbi:MAG: protein kinase domain-containing protein [Jatrophihabitans sp.]|uniref:serine/threonine-protein kinase n=1 Tax=Jatrophihabitans sp. TaxID=1932789 RepID=UPI003F7FE4D3